MTPTQYVGLQPRLHRLHPRPRHRGRGSCGSTTSTPRFPSRPCRRRTPTNLAGRPHVVRRRWSGSRCPSTQNREAAWRELPLQLRRQHRFAFISVPRAATRWRRDDAPNRRIHGLSGLAINGGASSTPTGSSTGLGDPTRTSRATTSFLIGTGPAAVDAFPRSADGLGNRIIGTSFNCSGATTPWGSVMSAEENFQGSSLFFRRGLRRTSSPTARRRDMSALAPRGSAFRPCRREVRLARRDRSQEAMTSARKHTAPGRFRHENIALRAEQGPTPCGLHGRRPARRARLAVREPRP